MKNSIFPCFLGSLWSWKDHEDFSHCQQCLPPLLQGDGAARLGLGQGSAETQDLGVGREKHLTALSWAFPAL